MTTKTTTKKTKEIKEVPTTNTKKFEVISDNLPTNPFAFEVLQLVSKQRTNAKKVEILKKYEDASLKSIFIWNFDESIISILFVTFFEIIFVFYSLPSIK